MLLQKDVLKITNELFPNNYGVLITGSQQNNEVLKKESDIDIVVLDTLSSGLWRTVIEKDGYLIEFMVIPITDAENLLESDLYDSRNTLLSFCSGKPLSNPHGLIAPLQKKANIFFSAVQYKAFDEYEIYLIELMRMPRQMTTSISPAEKTVILSSFVYTICCLETIRATNRTANLKLRLRRLNNCSPAFLQKVDELFQKGINNNFNDIIAYIQFYNHNYGITHLAGEQKYKRLVINISYLNFSLSEFINEIFPEIICCSQLNTAYLYFYLCPKKYTSKYKHHISLVFEIADKSDALVLLALFEKKVTSITKYKLNFECFCEGNIIDTLCDFLSSLCKNVSSILINLINADKDFDSSKTVDLFFKLCFYTKGLFNISNKDFKNINSFIAQKWLFTNEEQQKLIGYPAMLQFREVKMNKAALYYKNVMPELLNLVLMEYACIASNAITLSETFKIIEVILKEKLNYIIPENDINEAIFKASNFTDVKTIWLYKTVIESVLLTLNIPDSEKFNALYSCSKAINELGAEAA